MKNFIIKLIALIILFGQTSVYVAIICYLNLSEIPFILIPLMLILLVFIGIMSFSLFIWFRNSYISRSWAKSFYPF